MSGGYFQSPARDCSARVLAQTPDLPAPGHAPQISRTPALRLLFPEVVAVRYAGTPSRMLNGDAVGIRRTS
jgi:hypothetical protein